MSFVDEYRLERAEKRGPQCECETCHFCDMPVSPTHEHDHFPVPQSAGGTAVVPACKNCHDLKDRVNVGSHPVAEFLPALQDLFAYLLIDPEELATSTDPSDMMGNLDHERIEADWFTLMPYTRVLYAKLRRVQFQVGGDGAEAAARVEARRASRYAKKSMGRKSTIPSAVLQRIVTDRDQHRLSFWNIAKSLTAEGVLSPTGLPTWQESTVRRAYVSATQSS